MENKMQDSWKERFEKQFVDTYGEKDRKEWRIAYQPIDDLEDFIATEISKAKEERTEELRQAFHETFFKSGELWFDYLFEDGDVEQEKEAKEVVEEYWKDVLDKLSNKRE